MKNIGNHPVFSDFEVHNPQSGNIYKVAVRSEETGLNFCTCPDFKINTLGTCKHIEFTLASLKNIKGNMAFFKTGYQRPLNLSSVEGEFETDLNDLFKTGISFLEKLSHAISDGNSLKPALSSFIEKDKDTGKGYFKIPVPDEDTISKAVSAFGRLLQGLRK